VEQRVVNQISETTGFAKRDNKSVVTDYPGVITGTHSHAVIPRRNIKSIQSTTDCPVEVTDVNHGQSKLTQSQKFWLSIGEKIGVWLAKFKTKL